MPVSQALLQVPELQSTQRVVLVTTNSLVGGELPEQVTAALGSRCIETIAGVAAHAPRKDVVRIAARLATTRADAVVALGGGSVGDAVKVALLCLANGVESPSGMDRLRSGAKVAAPSLPYVMIPTTLSAAEFTPSGGVTDERGPRKEGYVHPELPPDAVVLDPRMTLATPRRLWLGTGLRAVDHAVEGWCSVNCTPHSDALARHALQILVPALRRSAAEPTNLEARLACQTAAWLSIQSYVCGVDFGASHGIGHALGGTAGMAHGETSSVMLPHVLRYNAVMNGSRQELLAEALGPGTLALPDVIAGLVAELGLPTRLRDAGVSAEILPLVAKEALTDPWIATNPRPIDGEAGLLGLLHQAF